jgi:hypothetical protein
MEIQNEIDNALASGNATFEVFERKNKVVFSIKDGSELITILDQYFGNAGRHSAPSSIISGSNAISVIKIPGYLISPSVFQNEKRVKDGYHIYQFDYVQAHT